MSDTHHSLLSLGDNQWLVLVIAGYFLLQTDALSNIIKSLDTTTLLLIALLIYLYMKEQTPTYP